MLRSLFSKKLRTGRRGERIACQYLKRNGFGIIKRNWRCRLGEIDIIALDHRELVFIEVKTRKFIHESTFPAVFSVDQHKQHKLCSLAEHFLDCYESGLKKQRFSAVRFDFIIVLYLGLFNYQVEYIPDAIDGWESIQFSRQWRWAKARALWR